MARAKRTSPISEWTRTARKAAGYNSARKAADAAGVPEDWLRLVESGHIQVPSPERIAALERIYHSTAPVPEPVRDDDYERGFEAGFLAGWRAAGGGVSEPLPPDRMALLALARSLAAEHAPTPHPESVRPQGKERS